MNNLSIEELKKMRKHAASLCHDSYVSALDELIAIRELKGDQVNHAEHSDNFHFDLFAARCKEKLAAARNKGRGGWDNPEVCSAEYLAELLVHHLTKGNSGTYEDIANFAMMLHQRSADPKVLVSAARSLRFTQAEKDAVERALNAQPSKELKGDQVPVAYFAAAPDYGWDMFKNKEDAIAMCQAEIDAYRDCRDDGWDDDVQRVCWGVVLQKAEGFDQQGVHTSNSHHTYQTCDYSLQPEIFTAPQKPVVLPKSHYVCGCADRYMSEKEVKAAIEAAGGIVKDGE